MRKAINLLHAILAMMLLVTAVPAFAERDAETEGTSFWFGLPHCDRSSSETLRGSETNSPYELFVTSKKNTVVRLYNASGELIKSFSVIANKPKVEAFPDMFECKISEVIQNNGLFIESDDPIAVVVYASYKWTGEAYRVVPSEWLGLEYYTLNLYQDYVKKYDGIISYQPAQILIVSSDDDNDIQFTPTWETEKGVKKGQTKSIKLKKGQTYLIKGKINTMMTHAWETDLTGTHITSSKPIAVYSGHTKGSFPRHSHTMLGLKSDFMRNMYMDAMWPVELLGKDYISVPVAYIGRTAGYGTVPEDRGDIIRFVATQDNTTIRQLSKDGSKWDKLAGPLQKGQDYRIMEQLEPGIYRADKPVLVGQYGKSWWISPVTAKYGDEDVKNEDELMNPPKNGQGMMFALSPNERWCNYSGFNSPKGGMYNFVNVIFKTAEEDDVYFDGRKIRDEFGSKIQRIPGSIYSYVNAPVNPGGHVVKSADDKPNVRFAVYAYGNLDGAKDGFAYGYPAAVNYYAPCNDSIFITSSQVCETLTGKITALDLQADTSCAGILKIESTKAAETSAKFVRDPFKVGDKEVGFSIKFSTKRPDSVTVKALTRAGATVTKTFYYYPDLISFEPNVVNFGKIELGKEVCLPVTIKNDGLKEFTIKRLYLENSVPEFKINGPVADIVIAAGGTFVTNVCVKTDNPDIGNMRDKLMAELECKTEGVQLTASTGEPDIDITNASWTGIAMNTWSSEKIITITNNGNADAEIYSMDFPDKNHFRVIGLDLTEPLIIAQKESRTFTVQYNPLAEVGVVHTTRADFVTNARKTKQYSVWTGDGIDGGPSIVGYDWQRRRVIDEYNKTKLSTDKYEADVTISATGNIPLKITKITLENNPENAFEIDAASLIGTTLNEGTPLTFKAYFMPELQKSYDAIVKIETEYTDAENNTKKQSATDALRGDGIQPHINVTDLDFGTINLTDEDATKTMNVTVSYPMEADGYEQELEIYDFTFTGASQGKYSIDPSFTMPTQANPIRLDAYVNTEIQVPIVFTPGVSGYYNDVKFIADCNADIEDKNIGTLDGDAFDYSVTTTPYPFAPTYITTARTGGTVEITNTGFVPVVITKMLNSSIEDPSGRGDDNKFEVVKSYIKDNPTVTYEPNKQDIEIAVNKTLVVELTFRPMEVRGYDVNLVYHFRHIDDLTNQYPKTTISRITGTGMEYLLVSQVPTGYIAKPKEVFGVGGKPAIDVKLRKDNGESKNIEDAFITKFKAYVKFVANNPKPEMDVYPLANSVDDIITEGTMTEGWTVNAVNVIGDKELYVTMTAPAGSVLKTGNGILFKFKLKAYLSDMSLIPLEPTFTVVEVLGGNTNPGYFQYDKILGDVQVERVCIDEGRLVQYFGKDYSMAVVAPNPVRNVGTISYTVPINCTVNIDIHNSLGEKVTTLVNKYHEAGTYQANVDVNQLGLPSGAYTYTIQMGPYSDTKVLNITK